MAEPLEMTHDAAVPELRLGPHRIAAPRPAAVRLLVDAARRSADELIAERRRFHRMAELGWRETSTTASIVAELAPLGYEIVSGREFLKDTVRLGLGADAPAGAGDTGCIASFTCPQPGPTVCLRADIDALPIAEAVLGHRPADEGWASDAPGVMHACGHDGHIAIGLGVARLLRPFLDRGRGRFLLIFQPAEEGGRGARSVVEAGWLDPVDLFLGFHIGLGVPTGTVALGVDGFLATRKYKAELRGVSAHAGKAPETGRNALLAACQAVLGLHALAQSSEPGVRVNVGTLEAGRSLNVVPDIARLSLELRAMSENALDRLTEAARTLLKGTAAAHQVELSIELIGEAGGWSNEAAVVRFADAVCEAGGLFPRRLFDHRFGASEDATLMARRVASRGGLASIFVLGADLASGHHTPTFDFDEAVLAEGSALLAAIAASVLVDGAG